MGSLLDLLGGGSASGSGSSLDSILGLVSTISGLSGRSMSDEAIAGYVSNNLLDTSKLNWKTDSEGHKYIPLTADDWSLINSVDLNMFVDDGSGYIDLGLDNLYYIDDYGNLIADTEGTWISINQQPVAYYHVDTTGDTITGKVPALLNGERVNIIVNLSYSTGKGSIAGAEPIYDESVTETEFRGLVEIRNGDVIDFICDYYGYDGTYLDSYKLGDRLTVSGTLQVSDTVVKQKTVGLYKLTDIYGQSYWTEKFNK